jgi:hypothetical protein
MKRIDAKKIGLVHIARRRLRFDDDAYRDVLRRAAGVSSARELSAEGFDLVMVEFRRLGFVSDAHRRNLGHRAGMASPGQLGLIRKLWREWSDNPADEAGLNHWLEKIAKASALRFLTPEAAGAAIVGLKAMVARKAASKKAS